MIRMMIDNAIEILAHHTAVTFVAQLGTTGFGLIPTLLAISRWWFGRCTRGPLWSLHPQHQLDQLFLRQPLQITTIHIPIDSGFLTPGKALGNYNRRQVAAYAGLAPTPWQSGQVSQDQGVSKSGNPRLRATLIQVAWLWVRHQPTSALTAWFKARVALNGGRQKKSTIVALARKLLVALWKYVNAGVVIEGAVART